LPTLAVPQHKRLAERLSGGVLENLQIGVRALCCDGGGVVLRVGFIGLGAISHENVLGYLDSPDAQIVAVSCLSEAEAGEWLAKYGLDRVKYFRDYREMLDITNFDIVEILTPHDLHYRQALDCARAQVKGISLQKPMAINLRQCDGIIEACKKNGVKLKVYDNFVFYPVYLKARKMVHEGLLGDLLSIRVNTMAGLREGAAWPWCFHPDSWRVDLNRSGVGPLVGDDGFHKFSLARWFMRRDFEKVGAWIDPETPLDAPAYIRVKFRRLSGDPPKYAQIDFSFSPRMSIPCEFWLDDFVEIVGERGIMWVNQCSAAGNRELFRGNKMSSSPAFPPIAVFLDGQVTTYSQDMSPSERNWSTSFVASTKHFIKVMKEGGDPIYTGEEGREITRYAIAALLSAQENRDVYLDEITAAAEENKTFEIRTNFCNPKAFVPGISAD
jgi:predicted dehydrogenase